MTRKSSIRGEVKPLSELRGGQTKKRSQEPVRLSQKAARHEMLADIADRDGETHTAILERGDAKRARAEAEPLLERIGPTGRILEAAGEIAVLDKGPQGMTLHPNICTVLEYPNSIAVEASQRRMELATQAEALEPALDAAVAGEARNSIEAEEIPRHVKRLIPLPCALSAAHRGEVAVLQIVRQGPLPIILRNCG